MDADVLMDNATNQVQIVLYSHAIPMTHPAINTTMVEEPQGSVVNEILRLDTATHQKCKEANERCHTTEVSDAMLLTLFEFAIHSTRPERA